MKIKSTLKRLTLVLCCALLSFSFAACSGTYVPPQTGGTLTPSTPSTPSDPSDDATDVFTVRLRTLTSSTFPLNGYKLTAYWTEEETSAVYSADFDSDGVATCSGLDGDYRVTLSTLPSGYTYDSNAYEADNYSKETRIVLYDLSSGTGKGTGWYDEVCALASTGFYRATLTKSNYIEGVHYMFTPTVQGEYTIESMIDTTNNELNPILDVYNGNSNYVGSLLATQDDGGASNTYTKNFKWTIQIDARHVGNSFLFCVRATALTESMFPINVDFKLERDGEFAIQKTEYVLMTPTHDFDAAAATAFDDAVGGFTYIAHYNSAKDKYLDGSIVAYSDPKNGGDGYYHLCTKDEDGNVVSWGKKIYAKLNQDNEILVTDSRSGFLDSQVSVRFLSNAEQDSSYSEEMFFNYQEFITTYASHVNGNGVYPVTKELKIFLQRFSVSSRYFNDGNGFAEGTYSSSESNQWLFACGYYA